MNNSEEFVSFYLLALVYNKLSKSLLDMNKGMNFISLNAKLKPFNYVNPFEIKCTDIFIK